MACLLWILYLYLTWQNVLGTHHASDGLSKSDHLTDAEVSGYRFQPQRQRHVLEDTLEASDHEKKDTREAERTKTKLAETVSTGAGAEPIC